MLLPVSAAPAAVAGRNGTGYCCQILAGHATEHVGIVAAPPPPPLQASASRKQAKTSAAATPSGRAAAAPGSQQATPATAAKATPATAAKATPALGITPMTRPTPSTHAKSSMKKALQVGLVPEAFLGETASLCGGHAAAMRAAPSCHHMLQSHRPAWQELLTHQASC